MRRDMRKQDGLHRVRQGKLAGHKQSLAQNPDRRAGTQARSSRARDALKRSPAACLQAGFGRGTRLADAE
jgi:hypothetical protein